MANKYEVKKPAKKKSRMDKLREGKGVIKTGGDKIAKATTTALDAVSTPKSRKAAGEQLKGSVKGLQQRGSSFTSGLLDPKTRAETAKKAVTGLGGKAKQIGGAIKDKVEKVKNITTDGYKKVKEEGGNKLKKQIKKNKKKLVRAQGKADKILENGGLKKDRVAKLVAKDPNTYGPTTKGETRYIKAAGKVEKLEEQGRGLYKKGKEKITRVNPDAAKMAESGSDQAKTKLKFAGLSGESPQPGAAETGGKGDPNVKSKAAPTPEVDEKPKSRWERLKSKFSRGGGMADAQEPPKSPPNEPPKGTPKKPKQGLGSRFPKATNLLKIGGKTSVAGLATAAADYASGNAIKNLGNAASRTLIDQIRSGKDGDGEYGVEPGGVAAYNNAKTNFEGARQNMVLDMQDNYDSTKGLLKKGGDFFSQLGTGVSDFAADKTGLGEEGNNAVGPTKLDPNRRTAKSPNADERLGLTGKPIDRTPYTDMPRNVDEARFRAVKGEDPTRLTPKNTGFIIGKDGQLTNIDARESDAVNQSSAQGLNQSREPMTRTQATIAANRRHMDPEKTGLFGNAMAIGSTMKAQRDDATDAANVRTAGLAQNDSLIEQQKVNIDAFKAGTNARKVAAELDANQAATMSDLQKGFESENPEARKMAISATIESARGSSGNIGRASQALLLDALNSAGSSQRGLYDWGKKVISGDSVQITPENMHRLEMRNSYPIGSLELTIMGENNTEHTVAKLGDLDPLIANYFTDIARENIANREAQRNGG